MFALFSFAFNKKTHIWGQR